MTGLNRRQREAVEWQDGPLLVLAGAGSGKTRVITRRIVRLIESGVDARNIVALTFTNKAADEMRARVAKMVGAEVADDVVLSTFHSLGARMMRKDPKGFGLDSARFSILDQGDVFGLFRGLLREYGHHGSGTDRRFDLGAVVQRVSLWKNAFVGPDTAPSGDDEYDAVAASIYPHYEARLRSLGAVDFDDLVCRVATALDRDEKLRRKWQRKFTHLLVDEYQDTNLAQFEMLRLLSGSRQNLCVVGDDDQAIYGWRGADVRNILEFDKAFPGAHIVKLEQNYRSRAPIIRCANSVIRQNRSRRGKKLTTERKGGSKVTLVAAAEPAQESRWVGKKVLELARAGTSPDEIAVLYRSAIQAKAIEDELREHGLRYRVLGGQPMFDRKEVRDVLAYLKVLVAPRDELAVRRALDTPPRGIGATTLSRLTEFAAQQGVGLLDAVHRASEVEGVGGRPARALAAFSSVVRGARGRARKGDVGGALRGLVDTIGLRAHVRKEHASDASADGRWAGVAWLLGSVERYEKRAHDRGARPRWREYLGNLALDSRSEDQDSEPAPAGEVTLATLHSAKGLEWDCVFVIGCEEEILPHRRVANPRASDAIAGDIEEERRLFYVGMTRAREQLWLTRAKARSDQGREVVRAPSRFLEELPKTGVRTYDIAVEEELSSDDIGRMADEFLSLRPE